MSMDVAAAAIVLQSPSATWAERQAALRIVDAETAEAALAPAGWAHASADEDDAIRPRRSPPR